MMLHRSPTGEVHLRAMVEHDIDVVVGLARGAELPHASRASLEREFTLPFSCRQVAECHGRVIGYSIHWSLGDEADLHALAVVPDSRRQGVGRALLRGVLAAVGAGSCTLEVAEDNHAARALYEECAFYLQGRRPDYYGAGRSCLLLRHEAARSAGEVVTSVGDKGFGIAGS